MRAAMSAPARSARVDPQPTSNTAAVLGALAYLTAAVLAGWILDSGDAPDWAHVVSAVLLSVGLLVEGLRSDWVRH